MIHAILFSYLLQQQRDLAERINAANGIIASLEAKLKQLANDKDCNIPALLQVCMGGRAWWHPTSCEIVAGTLTSYIILVVDLTI